MQIRLICTTLRKPTQALELGTILRMEASLEQTKGIPSQQTIFTALTICTFSTSMAPTESSLVQVLRFKNFDLVWMQQA